MGVDKMGVPRVIVAGLSGDSGKTFVTLGILRALVRRGLPVAGFKKGPDFIDAAWIGRASGRPGRNLDTFLMDSAALLSTLQRGSMGTRVAVIEGNRGLFDGLDPQGSHSTAELAKTLRTPVVLVVNTTKTTRTVAALVAGCRALDPDLDLQGVILNRVATCRQEQVIRQAVLDATGLEVLGAVPRLDETGLISRHLGLVTVDEEDRDDDVLDRLADLMEKHVDIDRLLGVAATARPLEHSEIRRGSPPTGHRVRVGVLRDRAFSFYYQENLELLEEAGAQLVAVSPLETYELPEIDALYAGGGFPEVYARRLSENRAFRDSLRRRAEEGLPIWAECGGLMYLARTLRWGQESFPMVGALPIDIEQMKRPQGHGYVEGEVEAANPFLKPGTRLRGHEFHYSRTSSETDLQTVLRLQKGTGIGGGRDGLCYRSVLASYTHLHALSVDGWGEAWLRAASGGAV